MHTHTDSHQFYWYAWGNISASISAALAIHKRDLVFLHLSLCLAGVSVSCSLVSPFVKYISLQLP